MTSGLLVLHARNSKLYAQSALHWRFHATRHVVKWAHPLVIGTYAQCLKHHQKAIKPTDLWFGLLTLAPLRFVVPCEQCHFYECQLSGFVHSVHRIKLQMYFGNFNLWLYPIELHRVARTADRHEVASVGLSVAFYHYRTISSNLSPLTTGSSISGNTNCALGHSASRVNETVLFEVVRVPLNWLHLFDLPSGGNANGLIDALYIARILI